MEGEGRGGVEDRQELGGDREVGGGDGGDQAVAELGS